MDSGIKLVSWNVNGLRAVVKKGFEESFQALDADILMLQETKLQAGLVNLEFEGYESFWNYADKPGYSGTAIYTKLKPLSVSYGIGVDEFDHEGRVITAEFDNFYAVCVYVPNSQDHLQRLEYRQRWDKAFLGYLSSLAEKKGVIVGGDFNVAAEEIDLKNPDTNHHNAGFTDEEREGFRAMTAAGLCDCWRIQHPDEKKYSWWSYRMNARERNVGWRIDYLLMSEGIADTCIHTDIHNEIFGSDHCPVELVCNL